MLEREKSKLNNSVVAGICVLLLLPILANLKTFGQNVNSDKNALKFSSVYTDTTKDCKGAEPVFTCKGFGDYKFVMDVGGVFQNARIESSKSDYNLTVAERQSIGWNPKVEWRMANGKPFAVIARVDVNDENADVPKKTGEKLIVKGLKGYENIDDSIDAKMPQANEKAREIADQKFAGNSMENGGAIQTDAAFSDGKAALLPDSEIRSLKTVKAAVAVPTYLPTGFTLKKIAVEKTEQDIVNFSIFYADAKGKSFQIQSTNEGLGDMAVKRELKIINPYFMDTAQENAEFYTGHDENDAKTIASEWLCSAKKYQPKMANGAQCFQLLSDSKSLSPDEAMKIMQSLRYLKR